MKKLFENLTLFIKFDFISLELFSPFFHLFTNSNSIKKQDDILSNYKIMIVYISHSYLAFNIYIKFF
jgi:hypothetical protein